MIHLLIYTLPSQDETKNAALKAFGAIGGTNL